MERIPGGPKKNVPNFESLFLRTDFRYLNEIFTASSSTILTKAHQFVKLQVYICTDGVMLRKVK